MDKLAVKIVSTSDLPIPHYQTVGSAGFDFYAAIAEPVTLQPGQRELIPSGLHFELPVGYELQVRSRSGLSAKFGVSVAQGIGTVDSDYRGEVKVILINLGQEPFVVNHGDRIAQGVIAPYTQAALQVVDSLDETERGQGGFGSTGS